MQEMELLTQTHHRRLIIVELLLFWKKPHVNINSIDIYMNGSDDVNK